MTIKAIVTGHSHGLGAGIAAALLRQGIAVLGVSRGKGPQPAAQRAPLLVEAEIDLSDHGTLSAWVDGDVLGAFMQGCTTILLVNNAGTVQPMGALQDQVPGEVLRAVMLNVGAPLALAAAVVRLRGDAACRILHISSGAARNAYPGWSVYCATKAALDHHSRAVALDGNPAVLCCSLAPGVIDTAMQGQIRATPGTRFPHREKFVGLKEADQLQDPAEAGAAVVAYLLAPHFGSEPVADVRD